jgi:ribonuclease Y
MEPDAITIGLSVVLAVAGIAVGYFVSTKKGGITMEQYREKADNKITKTREMAQQIKKETKEKTENLKIRNEEEEKRLKEQFKRVENLIVSKKEQIIKKEARKQVLKDMIGEEENKIKALEEKNGRNKEERTAKLSQMASLPMETASEQVIDELKRDLELMREERIKKYERYLEDEKVRIAKNIIVNAIQRYSSPTSVEKKSLTVTVPRDDLKSLIIGENAKNLLLLEELTDCDIIFNDAPNSIIISCFDLVKKHIARETILKLLKEKVVNENKIKQKIEQVKVEMEKLLIKIGRNVVDKLELKNRKFPDNFYKIIGRLQFRTSYGQNIIKHSMEVGYFALMLGGELNVNLQTCRVGGFLHDVGKAIDHEIGEPHDQLSKKIMEKFEFSWEEVHAAWTHHDAIPIETAEAMLVKAGDAVSAGRPGARQETLEKYLERIAALEEIGNSYEGVNKAYAISAGREIRILVEPTELDDENLRDLARGIADDIEENVSYPGKVKVNVIRKTQSIDYAKSK